MQTAIDGPEVHCPSGLIERIKLPGIDAIFMVVEGSGRGTPISDHLATSKTQ
jgi:hypothetical protein